MSKTRKWYARALYLVFALALVAGLAIVPVPVQAATVDMDSPPGTVGDAVGITNATGTTLESIPTTGTIYIWVHDAGQNTWSLDPWVEESVTVAVKIYRGDGVRQVGATKNYSAIEQGANSDEFRTAAISVSDLGVEPGYRLVVSATGAATMSPISATGMVGGAAAYNSTGPVWTLETAAANSVAANDMNLAPDFSTPLLGDAYYFGHASKFNSICVNIGTPGVGAWTIAWEYATGPAAWAALTGVVDNTTGFAGTAGLHNVSFTEPADWVMNAPGGGLALMYYVRARVTVSAATITTSPKGTQAWVSGAYYVRAEVEFAEGGPYDIDGTMTLRVKDDSLNADALNVEQLNAVPVGALGPGNVVAASIDDSTVATPTDWKNDLAFLETGKDTGVFEYKTTPNTADTVANGDDIWCGDAMKFIYENPNTTLGAPAPTANQVAKTAYVNPSSISVTSFNPATLDPTAVNVQVVVTDRDKSPDQTAGGAETIPGSAVVVKSYDADDSEIDSLVVPNPLTEDGAVAGKFARVINFGAGVNQLDITGAAKIEATYTDPSDASDVSTATAAIGKTVEVYDATNTLRGSYMTINTALAHPGLAAGWSILVKSGYSSTTEGATVAIAGAGVTGVTIKSASTAVIDAGTGVGDTITVGALANDVTIDGFTIKNSDPAAQDLINIIAAGNNLTVKNCTFDLTVGGNDKGIEFGNAAITGVLVDSCTFNVKAGDIAIESILNDGVRFNVKNCTFNGSGGIGLNLDRAGTAVATPVGVTSNTFDGLQKALDITQTAATTTFLELKWNTIKNCSDAAVGAIETNRDPTVSIEGNDIKDNLGYSIWAKGALVGDDNNIDVVFNNITGNAKALRNDAAVGLPKLNAKHNWWGTAAGPATTDTTGEVTTTFYLTAPVKLTAEYMKPAVAPAALTLDAHLTTGVKVVANIAATLGYAGVAEYTESPKTAMADASFYDAFVDTTNAGGINDTVTVSFYTGGITADSVAYFWNDLTGTWDVCSHQGFNTFDGSIWVLARDQIATVPTSPTIQELTGGMFAISTVPAAVTITATAGDNGSISPSGAVVVEYGADQEFTITPDTGYQVEDVLVDGASVGAVTSYTFEDVTADHTIHATFTVIGVPTEPEDYDDPIYGGNGNGIIDLGELLNGIEHYLGGEINITFLLDVIELYLSP